MFLSKVQALLFNFVLLECVCQFHIKTNKQTKQRQQQTNQTTTTPNRTQSEKQGFHICKCLWSSAVANYGILSPVSISRHISLLFLFYTVLTVTQALKTPRGKGEVPWQAVNKLASVTLFLSATLIFLLVNAVSIFQFKQKRKSCPLCQLFSI